MSIAPDQALVRELLASIEQVSLAGPPALADRLLAGVAHRRQARRRRAAALAVVVAVGVVPVGLLGLERGGSDTLLAAPGAGQPAFVPVTVAGAVTHEQAARGGLDGTAECESAAVRGTGAPQPGAAQPRLVAGYLTDFRGYEGAWGLEYLGQRTVGHGPEGPPADGLVAVCWFSGEIAPDGSVGGGPPSFDHQLLAVQLTGGDPGMRLDSRDLRPIPVLAPPLPAAELLTPELAGRPTVVHSQPDGVPVVDVLRWPEPEPAAAPVDCVPWGCPTEEELAVRADLRLDGEPLAATDTRTLPPGTVVEVELSLELRPGDVAEVLTFGVGDGVGDLHKIDTVLARLDDLSGTQTVTASWTVPDDGRHLFVLDYTSPAQDGGVTTRRDIGSVQPG